MLAPFDARAAVVTFTQDTLIDVGNSSFDGQDIVVQACTVTANGVHAFNSVQVVGGGVLTHQPTTPAQEYSLVLAIVSNLVVDAASRIDVSGRGYANDGALGALTLGNTNTGAASGRSGGSYGGLGAPASGGQANSTYGDYHNPNELGSAGAGTDANGGAGGGLVRISAASAHIDGALLANGANAVDSGDYGGGGGSGGGVWLHVGSLSGGGLIAANGGGPATWGAAGGGGRVAVYYGTANGFDLTNQVTVHGANGNGTGSVGTVYLKESGAVGELLLASHGTPAGLWTPLGLATDSVFQVENLVIAGTNVVAATAREMPIQANAVAVLDGAVLTHQPTTLTQEFSLQLTITNGLLVDSNSVIDVSGRGYVNDGTLGALTLGNTNTGAASGRSGGSYGGLGAPASGGQGNSTYGDYHNPNELGSAGAGAQANGGAGGGLARISAASVQIDGALLANGANAVDSGDYGGGGGSGGGVWLHVGSLSGSGLIAANGGGPAIWGAAGGGGRVAIYYGTANGFDLTNRVTAHGANGNGTGSVGTVYLKESGAVGELLLASHGTPAGLWTPLGLATDSVFQVENLVIAGTNVVAAPAHEMPIQAGSIAVVNGAMLTHQPTTTTQGTPCR